MNPYQTLPARAFWRPSVADISMFDIGELWEPAFSIGPKTPVVTFGSCFAQHIGKALQGRGFNWLNTEAAPDGLSEESARKFNYNVFSCRTGNIYTTSLLRQWASWAMQETTPPDEIWEKDGRFHDPFRPAIEPDGFETPEELMKSRQRTIDAFRDCITQSRVFVFTLGLTESWKNTEGYEYPICPGTIAGAFDETRHVFENQSFQEVRKNLGAAIRTMKQANDKLKFLLTVSPVPLTATRSGDHVLVATSYSKSVLRAVAGEVAAQRNFVDYFPSYEIINSPVFRGSFFEPNQRSVNPYGVDFVMSHFFAGQDRQQTGAAPRRTRNDAKRVEADRDPDVVCEEELLAAFGPDR